MSSTPEPSAAGERRSRRGGLLGWLVPDECVSGVEAIDLLALYEKGIRCLLIDIDNTLVPWSVRDPAPVARRFVERARTAGLVPVILSNARDRRRIDIARLLEVAAGPRAFKPLRRSFRRAARLAGCTPRESAVVGDQLLTDVLGARLSGMYTILVDPLSHLEFVGTRIGRGVERLLLSAMVRRRLLEAEVLRRRLGVRGLVREAGEG